MRQSAMDLLPHRPPMLFIDSAVFANGTGKALATVRPDWLLLDGQGELSGAGYIELMAQGYAAIAALSGQAFCEESGRPDPPDPSDSPDTAGASGGRAAPMGFLVGVKHFRAHRSAPVGETLCMTADLVGLVGPFSVFNAAVRDSADALVAEAQIKVVLAGEGGVTPGTLFSQGAA